MPVKVLKTYFRNRRKEESAMRRQGLAAEQPVQQPRVEAPAPAPSSYTITLEYPSLDGSCVNNVFELEVPSIGELNEASSNENEPVPPTSMASEEKAAELADKATIDPIMERQRNAVDTCSREPTDDNVMCPLDISDITMHDPEVETDSSDGCDTDSAAQAIGAPIAPAVEQSSAHGLWLAELTEAEDGIVAEYDQLNLSFDFAIFEEDSLMPNITN